MAYDLGNLLLHRLGYGEWNACAPVRTLSRVVDLAILNDAIEGFRCPVSICRRKLHHARTA